MTDMIRCPGCRGAKKVPKLGGMIGDCNMCSGNGEILEVDRPVMVKIENGPANADIIAATAQALPVSDNENHSHSIEIIPIRTREIQEAPFEGNIPKEKIQAAVDSVKIDRSKAVFKHKKN